MEAFDLIVIGAGPGGYVAAIRAAQLGLKVACVEKEKALGGTCLRVGCIPSKALLESSQHFAQAHSSFKRHGILIEKVQLDLAAMQRRKRQIVSILTRGVETLFRKNKIKHFIGKASLLSANSVRICSLSREIRLESRAILIATGSAPAHLSNLHVDGKCIFNSSEALELEAVPQSLIVVGAGFIGLELGSVWSRLGAQVVIIEAMDQILPQMDRDLAAQAKRLFSKQGLDFKLNTKLCRVERREKNCRIFLDNDESIDAEKILVSVGRVPCSSNLGLERLGVKKDSRGYILTDPHFATNVKGIYALGDVRGGAMLAHKASAEGIAFAECIVKGEGSVNYQTIASVVFTDPQIASIGETEQSLITKNQRFHKSSFPYRANARARISGQTEGFAKLLTDKPGGRILGAHLLGTQAGELINEIAFVMKTQQSTETLARNPCVHPTFGEILQEAALANNGREIHC